MVAQAGHAVADELDADPIMRREPLAMRDPGGDLVGRRSDPQIRRPPNSSGLYDVLDLILDKGIVIDAFVRVSLVGIELLTVDLRVVIASVDTYLRYAEGVERLQVYQRSDSKRLPDMVQGGMKGKALKKGAEEVKEAVTGDDDEEEEEGEGEKKEGLAGALTKGVRHILKKGVGGILHNVAGDKDEESGQDEGDEGEDEERGGREQRESARSQKNGNAGRAKAGSRR